MNLIDFYGIGRLRVSISSGDDSRVLVDEDITAFAERDNPYADFANLLEEKIDELSETLKNLANDDVGFFARTPELTVDITPITPKGDTDFPLPASLVAACGQLSLPINIIARSIP